MRINKNIIDCIMASNNIAVFIHVRPDADALGSASSFKQVMAMYDKHVDIYVDCDDIGDKYLFIKNVNNINRPKIVEYDLAVALDCTNLSRMGKYVEKFNSISKSINIDHHYMNDKFAKYNYVRDVSSTGEILFSLYKQMKVKLNKDICTALYAAISSDTGCFMNSNTTADCHKIVGELIEYNVDFEKANFYLFRRKSLGQIQLQKIALNNIRFYFKNKLSLIYLMEKDYDICNCNDNDTLGLADTIVSIENVEIGILISEIKPKLFAVSFRSKGLIDVSIVAKKFGGGGHINASGCNIFGGLNTVINKLVRACKKSIC